MRRHRFILSILIISYVAVATTLSVLRCLEFYCRNWDLGIFEQALWSTTHGHVLFESGDYEIFGFVSFFQVHPSLLMFPLSFLYALSSTPWTLLLLQSVVTGLAALPLFYLAREITASESKALITIGVYLAWAPLLSANLYDFHLEAFLPLELFSFFYLWLKKRYLLGFAVATLSFLTLEVTPVLVLFFLVFLSWDFLVSIPKQLVVSLNHCHEADGIATGPRGPAFPIPESALALFAILCYILLRLLQGPWISSIVGAQPSFTPTVGFSLVSLNMNLRYFQGGLFTKVTYWFLLYALLGFIPLKVPRTVLLVLPWLAFTFFTPYLNVVRLGYAYGYVAAVPLLIGFAYGLARLSFGVPHFPSLRANFRHVSSPTTISLLLVVVLGANLLLSPVNPLAQITDVPADGMPGYWVSYTPGPGYAEVENVVTTLIHPENETWIFASDDLFIFVANDIHAYSTLLPPQTGGDFPFNATNLPEYVFLSQKDFAQTPAFLLGHLNNGSVYHILAIIDTTPVGVVTLYQLNLTTSW